jgi:histidinol dehydrogenase
VTQIFRLFSAAEAKRTILHRKPVGEVDITPSLAKGLERVFGERLPLEDAVRRILTAVRQEGDQAVIEWTARTDGVHLDDLVVSAAELDAAYECIPAPLREALHFAAARIRAFHEQQPDHSWLDWRDSGGALGQIIRPLERVGIYAPGGTAPYPSTLLMCAVTARVAGVDELIVTTPPGREPSGQIAPVLLAAAKIAGVEKVYRIGGAQAVAAMAYGTETIAKVDKIVGPGNIFVTLAKRQVYGLVDIDGLPGPTELPATRLIQAWLRPTCWLRPNMTPWRPLFCSLQARRSQRRSRLKLVVSLKHCPDLILSLRVCSIKVGQ